LLNAPAIAMTCAINVMFDGAIRWASFDAKTATINAFLAAGDLKNS